MDKKHKILLIDDSKVILNLLKNALATKGYEVITSNSALEGAEKIISSNFSLVISNLNMPEISGLDLLLWSKKNYPALKFSIMSASVTDEVKTFIAKNGAASIYEKGKPTTELLEIVSSTLTDGFYGEIKTINLFDFFNLISVSKLNKTIVINEPIKDINAKIYFKSGNIINAEYGEKRGEKAFSEILNIDKGTFYEEEFVEPENLIKVPFEFLMINTARIIDEASTSNVVFSKVETKSKNAKILIVDDDVIITKLLSKYLTKYSEYLVDIADSAVIATEKMKGTTFDIIISDLDMPEVNGLDFLFWVKQNYAQTHFILISGTNVTTEQLNLASLHGALKFIKKPLKYDYIKKLIDNLMTETKFSGIVNNINLMDFIQVVSMSKTSTIISVKENITNLTANIYISKGNLVHTTFGELKGEEAFFKALAIKSGNFSDSDYIEPDEITIKIPLSKLLIRAFAILDKSNNEDETNQDLIASANALFIERALAQQELFNTSKDNFELYDVGIFYGLIIDKATKRDVLNKFSTIGNSEHIQGRYVIYNKLGLTFVFNDLGLLKAIDFYEGFTGTLENSDTNIKTPLSKINKVYLSSSGDKGFISNNIAFYATNNKLNCLRLANFSTQRDFGMSDEALENSFSDYYFYKDLITDSIDEEGKFLDFEIFKTSKDEIKEYFVAKNIQPSFDSTETSLIYERLGFSFNFESSGILEQITFNTNFRNKTLKGIRIGDRINKAFSIYGTPRFQDKSFAVWENISVFSDENNVINSIFLGAI